MFDFKTYQAFQKMIERNDAMLNSYDYIVCDEAHYFVSDSSFNPMTELAFKFLNNNKKVTKIYMTATPECLSYLPWSSKIEVLNEANFNNNNVKDMYRYEKDETALAVVSDENQKGNKVLIFHNSIDTISDFKVESSEVLHAGNRENSLVFKQIAKTQQFDCSVLNTTKLLTEGTEIKDDKVETVVIHGISDIDTFVQATARVRNQKINVYYKRISKKSIQAKLRYLDKQLEYYENFMELGEIEFVKEYGLEIINKSMKAFYLEPVIDPISHQSYTALRVHQTGLAYLQYQFEIYEFMDQFGFETFFDKYFPNIQYIDLEQLKKEGYIKLDIIDKYINKNIFKEQQQELVDVICNKYGLRAKNGATKFGMKTINSFFEENHISFVIESKRVKKDSKLHTVWVVREVN